MPTYTNEATVEKIIQRSLTTEEKASLDLVIANISKFVADYLNRNYQDIVEGEEGESEIEDSVMYYDGNGQYELFLDDDFTEITQIELLDSEGSTFETIDDEDDYILYPLNSSPKNSIVLRSYRFPLGHARVKITGKFTSGALPDAVCMAVTKLVADYVLNLAENENIKSESIEGYSKTLSDGNDRTAKQALILGSIDSFKKIDL